MSALTRESESTRQIKTTRQDDWYKAHGLSIAYQSFDSCDFAARHIAPHSNVDKRLMSLRQSHSYMRPLGQSNEAGTKITYDTILANAELVDQYLETARAAKNGVTKEINRDAAIKTYRSIVRILDKVAFTNAQLCVINQRLSVLKVRLMGY